METEALRSWRSGLYTPVPLVCLTVPHEREGHRRHVVILTNGKNDGYD